MIAYGLIMIAAVATGAIVARSSQRHLPLTHSQKLGLGLGAFCGAMIGAKLPFVFSDWDGLLSGAAWFSNGKTILLGLAGGYFGVEIAKWCLDLRVRTGDSFVVPVATAVAIGRVACFVGGCCYGRPTSLPWGVVFPTVDLVPRHPTQLYESAFHAACALGMAQARRCGWCHSHLMKLYIILYAGFRFGTEYLRPEPVMWAGFTPYQVASLVLAATFTMIWWRDRHSEIQARGASE